MFVVILVSTESFVKVIRTEKYARFYRKGPLIAMIRVPWITINLECGTVKPVFKTTWEIGTTWKIRTVTSVPSHIQYIAIDLGNKTTSEFRIVFHTPLGVPNSQLSLYFFHLEHLPRGHFVPHPNCGTLDITDCCQVLLPTTGYSHNCCLVHVLCHAVQSFAA